MSKKPNKFLKNLIIIFLAFFTLQLNAQDVNSEKLLSRADSLFLNNKYTESFLLYEQILDKDQMASPQMLMKMAYIKEGLGDHSNALYYLDLYYQKTADKRARNKMQSIAEENDLKGFQSGDTQFFLGKLNEYYLEFNVGAVLLALFFASIGIYRKLKAKPNAPVYLVISLLLVLALAYVTNFTTDQSEGIIIENHAYLMTGPSAGADLIEVVQKGHRVKILDEDGLWVKVNWDGRTAYIKASKIRRTG